MRTSQIADPRQLPAVSDRTDFEDQLASLRRREKAHTREADAIAAARRRLPMVEVDARTSLVGPNGTITLLEAFEGRRQWEASPDGWPQWWTAASPFRTDGRPIAQWPRLRAGHSDDLGARS